MNKLSTNEFKRTEFFTPLIETKHMIICSLSPASLASLSLRIGTRAVYARCHWPTGSAAANQRRLPPPGATEAGADVAGYGAHWLKAL